MGPLISVIIINWNTRDLVAECLTSVAEEAERMAVRAAHAATTAAQLVETIVVDNASHDGSVARLRQSFPWVHLLENGENVGFAAANNQALAHCHGQYVLLLNSDTKVLPGAFWELVTFLEAHPQAGAAGARYFNPDGSLQPSCYPAPTVGRELWRLFHLDKVYPHGTYPVHRWSAAEPRPVDIVQGAALMVRRNIVQELGLFDTDYFMYTEEVDLCRRIQQAGWQIWWVPQSTIIHYGGQSTRQVARAMFLQLYRSKILYFRKHHGRIATVAYKGVLLSATVARLLLTPFIWMQSGERRRQSLTLANHYRCLAMSLPGM
ncbi:MAG: glycosyltransferase family 2 protein [Caldilineaceae bacterium]|nr:glycosyltransferase family 2 protein [Caldilineaceae bacterium]